MDPLHKVRAILSLPDWKQDRLALTLNVSQSTIHRWVNGAEPRGNKRDAINDLYDQLIGSDVLTPQVRLSGYVGAGQEIYQFDGGDPDWVEAPPGARPETEAAEVRGDSMLPLYEDKTVLYYSKKLAPRDMLNRRCIVKLEDERMLVKTLRRGSEPGLWTLVSLNAPDIEDVAVQWASPIDWIRPK